MESSTQERRPIDDSPGTKKLSDLHRVVRKFVNPVILLICIFTIYSLVQFLKIEFLLIVGILGILNLLNRGARMATDFMVVFTSVFGLVPCFGWLALPLTLNPMTGVCGIWLFVILRFPFRDAKSGIAIGIAPIASLGFSYLWWRPLTLGNPTDVLSRLFPIWDLSAHFYFFASNLEHRGFIPTASSPIDLGKNEWAGVEYPTGIHFVWTKFVASDYLRFVDNPIASVPFFAKALVITFALCLMMICLALLRVSRISHLRARFLVSAISFGVCTVPIGLGVFGQTITSGFVNILVVLTGLSIIASLIIRPLDHRSTQALILSSAVLTIAYNWYPVLLLIVPALLIYVWEDITKPKLKQRMLLCVMWIATAFLSALPVLQTLTLGISHLAVDGGVAAIPASTSVLVLLLALIYLLMRYKSLSRSHRLLLVVPSCVHLSFFVYFALSEGSFPYYFQKLNLFMVIAAFLILIMSILQIPISDRVVSNAFHSLRTTTKSVALAILCTFAVFHIFGYIGPETQRFGKDSTFNGLLRRGEINKEVEKFDSAARILSAAASQTIKLPIEEKAWLTLILPNRVTRLDSTDGAFTTLLNIWFHSLSKSQTLTAFQTAYVATNFEIRGALTSDRKIAESIKDIFQPDSVTVFSTSEVTEQLALQPFGWRTLKFVHSEDS